MPATVIVGMQWGDEGKAKVLDALALGSDIVVRFQGGANAGHTVVVDDEKYKFHLVPSGILHEDKVCVIANGCVIDPAQLVKEVGELKDRNVKVDSTNLKISDRTHLVMPYHKLLDELSETRKEKNGSQKLGTTRRGIGPTYVDKVARSGLRVVDLLRPEYFKTRVRQRLEELNPILEAVYQHEPLDADKIANEILALANKIKPHITDTARYLNQSLKNGLSVLFEGAQGTLLDIDHGTYPFVTSSNSTAGGAATGSGVSPRHIDTSIGIVKAYSTRVGSGPFPTELKDAHGDSLREKGGEFGTTTGRPRRCGWFDAVAVRYAVEVSGVDTLALTKLDVLTGEKELKLCTHYTIDTKEIEGFPADLHIAESAQPHYVSTPGWSEPIDKIRSYEELPQAAKDYVNKIQELSGAKIKYIGVGPERDALIKVD